MIVRITLKSKARVPTLDFQTIKSVKTVNQKPPNHQNVPELSFSDTSKDVREQERLRSPNVGLVDTRALRGRLLVSPVAGAVSPRPAGSHCGLGKEPDPGLMGKVGRPPQSLLARGCTAPARGTHWPHRQGHLGSLTWVGRRNDSEDPAWTLEAHGRGHAAFQSGHRGRLRAIALSAVYPMLFILLDTFPWPCFSLVRDPIIRFSMRCHCLDGV